MSELKAARAAAPRMISALSALLGLAVVPACARPAESPPHGARRPASVAGANHVASSSERYVWQADTRSPQPSEPGTDELAARCPQTDAALLRVAARIAERELRAAPTLEVAELTFALRSEGAPYVWPRIWTLRGPGARAEAAARLDAWLAAGHEAGELRCAVARAAAPADGSEAFAAVAVGVLADLAPLPTRVRVGAWLDFRAELRVPADGIEVLVLGPRGRPHRVPATLDANQARARFRADRDGPFLVQLLANVAGGPRPVAEALVFAGGPPHTNFSALRAPGEEADDPNHAVDGLLAMLNAARKSEGLGALRPDTQLARIAQAHAEAMRSSKRVAHDAGDGTPADRASAAELALFSVGENVAHASDAAHAHRALWASPSHRSNLLDPRFETIGIGVARDTDGSVWVCEFFAHPR